MRLLFFKNIPLSWKLQSRFGHRCATRRPSRPSPFHPCHPWSSIQDQSWPKHLVPWWWMCWWRPTDHVLVETHRPWWRPIDVVTNATMIRNSLSSIGLEINNSKCELLLINHTDINKPQTSKLFQDHSPSLSIPDPIHWQLLGSPPAPGICPNALKRQKSKCSTALLKILS